MRKFLSIDNIVDVTSRVIPSKDTSIRLNTLCLMKYDENNPQPLMQEFSNKDDVFLAWGGASDLYAFAKTHFAFISKNATSPNLITTFNWNSEDTSSFMMGGEVGRFFDIEKINGEFSIEINGEVVSANLDLTGEAIKTLDDVASKIAETVNKANKVSTLPSNTRNKKDAEVAEADLITCSYDKIKNNFKIKTISKGKDSDITPMTAEFAGLLGLDKDSVNIIKGAKAIPTLNDALREIESINGDYFVVTPLFKFANEEEDLLVFGEWLHGSKGRFLGIYLWDNKKLGVKNSGVVDKLIGFNGLFIDWERVAGQNAFSSALISAMDLNKMGGVVNINFNNASQYLDVAVNEQAQFEGMNANRANAPYVFGTLGKYEVAYGQGWIMGDIPSANVYINNSFLKFKIQMSISQFFMSSNIVSARGGTGGEAIIALLTPIFNDCVKNSLIMIDKMSDIEKSAIIQNFNDSEKAIENIEKSGWAIEVGGINLAKREITLNYAYISNIPANRVIVKSYILGA